MKLFRNYDFLITGINYVFFLLLRTQPESNRNNHYGSGPWRVGVEIILCYNNTFDKNRSEKLI